MNKYRTEGNINFYEELKKNLEEVDDKNTCLITGDKLTDFFVKLNCGHKFNYIPLYKDLVNFKRKYRHMEKNTVSNNEIRCPYCRAIQPLIPFYTELGLEKVVGVNSYPLSMQDTTSITPIQIKYCEYISPNPYFDSNSTNVTELYVNKETPVKIISSYKNIKCNLSGYDVVLDNVTKVCCNYHHKKLLSEYNKQKLLKLKAEQKLKKESEKQQLKLKKEEKISKNMLNNINVVILPNKCSKILKTGPNKGKQCDCKIVENNLCKRHSNLEK